MMPGMNGFKVLSSLQKSHKDLPVVIMTGHSREKYESEARMLGAFAFLPKPFVIGEIEDLIARALARKKGGPGTGVPV
jgi:two-component system nitrogen regulation response regulator GlnG